MNLGERKYAILIIFGLVSMLFIAKLFVIQIADDHWQMKAARITESTRTIYPARGIIFDRNNEVIVDNVAAYDLMILPKKIQAFDTIKFASLANLSVEEVKQKIQKAKNYSFYKASEFLPQLNAIEYAAIAENLKEFPGFYGQRRTLRTYPHQAAPHVFGFIGEVNQQLIDENSYYKSGDYIGANGIEKEYEEYLRGKRGIEFVLVDVFNNIKGKYKNGEYDTSAVNGINLTSTIDIELQKYGETLMKNKRGSIVAIEPSTGELLCLVNNPSYDPNLLIGRVRSTNYRKLQNDTLKPLFNRALQAQYPPGSTFKLIQALIGLQEGSLSPGTRYSCNGGYYYSGRRLGCHAHGSPLSLNYAISTSCNAYFCNVFKNIIDNSVSSEDGFQTWRSYISKFGIGQQLGIDLPGEKNGFLPETTYYDKYYSRGKWKAHTIISLAIGQGELGVTPLQMANISATIANRGWYIRPHVIKKIGQELNTDAAYTEKNFTGIDKAHYEVVVDGMHQVIEKGTGRGVKFAKEINVCGKTGTAENPHGKDHSIFISFAPKENPKIAVAVYVENVGYGSTWAAPINSLILEKYLTDTITRTWVEKRILEGNLLYD